VRGTVLIAGASSGIGTAAAAAFAAPGLDVIATMRFPGSAATNGMLPDART
jgi:NAD(P)-dependent dehydrogenase (short-subunit alcohol dehydrogenase family)